MDLLRISLKILAQTYLKSSTNLDPPPGGFIFLPQKINPLVPTQHLLGTAVEHIQTLWVAGGVCDMLMATSMSDFPWDFSSE